ncbi:hypothetical protein R6Q59_009239 [Mikania micrantha]
MDEVEDHDYEEELLDYDDNEKAPDSVNNKYGAETVKKFPSIKVCFLLTVLELEDGGGRGTSETDSGDKASKIRFSDRFIVFKIEDQLVIIDRNGGPDESYEDFTN